MLAFSRMQLGNMQHSATMLLSMRPSLLFHVLMAAGKAAALLWLPQLLLLLLLLSLLRL
jgi:hypothetical protein